MVGLEPSGNDRDLHFILHLLVKHGAESVVARLNLTGERDILTILSGRERTVRLLDEIRATSGDDPAAWIPRLLEVA